MGGKAILLVTIGFGFILSYISFNIAGMSTRAVTNMSEYTASTESHNLAVTGAHVGLAKFYQDTAWFGTMTQDFKGVDNDLGNLLGSFTVSNTDLGGGRARLRSVSSYPEYGGGVLHDTVEVFFDTEKYNGFELYAWMSNFEGNLFWVTGDTIWGRSHSNGNFHINGSPVFMDKATTAKRFDPKPGTGQNQAVYKNGYEMGVASINFPPNFAELVNAANSGFGKYYDLPNIYLSLTAGTASPNDGMVYVRSSSGGPIIDSAQIGVGGFNGAIVGTGDVHVQGVLDGQLTIGSLDDIMVENDVTYQNRNYSSSDDLLGLVAEHNVIIRDNAANNSNCEIDGSIFCRDGSLLAENLTGRPLSGDLKITGSIVMDERGEVGKYAGSTLKRGFYKKFYYDQRLADGSIRPPFYPGYWVTRYSIANWWENVRIPDYRY